MEIWRHRSGDMEIWKHGKHGEMETWRHGDMDMKTWRQGHGDNGKQKMEALPPGNFP
jgi:hypothetical protein